jgi:hypothetical protein
MQIQVAGGTVTVKGNAVARDGTIQIESVISDNLENLNPVTWLTNLSNRLTPNKSNSAGSGTTPRSNARSPRRGTTGVVTDLTVTAGNRVQVLMNPVLRGLITPGTEVGVKINTMEDDYEITGDIVLRGGELQWFNRNFYLREGRIVFTETDAFDPRLTLRAEVRERDAEGEAVRITLQAENQRLSELALAGEENESTGITYSATPAKSETEIMALLGQNFIGDWDIVDNPWSIAGSTVDLALQFNLMRRIENGLRKLLNLDIFSMRATWLQNILADTLAVDETRQSISFGSVFNNSTIYVGKYLADDLYFDALLHFLYDESRILADPGSSGMIFQPEIGFEISAPFVNLRWSFAPEIYSWTQFLSPSAWVPATSITLSRRWDLEKVLALF